MEEYCKNEKGKLYNEDCLETMKRLVNDTVDLVVTSPPYDNLRDYKGYSFDFESVAKELFRVVKEGGVVVWVVGDSVMNGSESGTSFKQVLYFKELGLRLHDTMIYEKENAMPKTHNRYEQAFEYMFVLSKGKPKTFNPIKIPSKYAGKKYNLKGRSSGSSEEKNGGVRTRDEELVTSDFKIKGNIWKYQIGKNKGSLDDIWLHPATFPEKLAHDHIISWSNKDDLVYDPFMGSGTVSKMCEKLDRKWIGSELSQEYCEIVKNRIKQMKLI